MGAQIGLSSCASSRRASVLATGRPRPASMENLVQALERAPGDERPKRHSLPALGSRRTSFPSLSGLSEIWKPMVDEQIEIENEHQKDEEEQKEVRNNEDRGESRSEDGDEDGQGEKGEKKVEIAARMKVTYSNFSG